MDVLRNDVEKLLAKRARVSGGDIYMGRELARVLDNAEAQAKALQDEFTST